MTGSRSSVLNVGVLSAETLNVTFLVPYEVNGEDLIVEGYQEIKLLPSGKILFKGKPYDRLEFEAKENNGLFEVEGVTIGVNFHWERQETQRFQGNVGIIVENKPLQGSGPKLTLINRIDIEEYLKSVISSEMSATSSEELLKAHAVVSRSWLLAQIDGKNKEKNLRGWVDNDDEKIVWYDRDDHANFDVCADDHCQRYQGITRQTSPFVEQAVEATRGLVLADGSGAVCDARFSKCCGGVFEEFESCWDPSPHAYLQPLRDDIEESFFPNLKDEGIARQWIEESPDAFCNTEDIEILRQILNSYDQETPDFYRWEVNYSREQLSELLLRRTGTDFGDILEMEALERGTSGRIVRLRIKGTKKEKIIGKELEIRRSLSKSHLYSSAFIAQVMRRDDDEVPGLWRLRGAGWGHGVGMCQIGAAVMAHKGYSFEKIVRHYFPGAELTKLY